MGNVSFGPPTELIQQLATRFGIKTFVETGTYLGGTSAWAAGFFDRVLTSELHPESFARATDNLRKFPHVTVFNEASPPFLVKVLRDMSGRAFFWLDAHMMPGSVTAGLDDECPVLDELRAILAWSPADAYIFIDDARLFLAPAALPHKAEQWPSIREILDALEPLRTSHHIVVSDDIVMVVPLEAKAFLVDYLQRAITEGREARRGTQMMRDGAWQLVRGVVRTAKDLRRRIAS